MIITVPVDLQARVWANWAVVQESDHAFRESCGFRGYPYGPTHQLPAELVTAGAGRVRSFLAEVWVDSG